MPAVLYPVGPQQPADFRGLAFARSQQRAPQNLVSLFDQNRQGGGNDLMSILLPLLFSQQGRAEERRQFDVLSGERGAERETTAKFQQEQLDLLRQQASAQTGATEAQTNILMASLFGQRKSEAVAASQNRFARQIEEATTKEAPIAQGRVASLERKVAAEVGRAGHLGQRITRISDDPGSTSKRGLVDLGSAVNRLESLVSQARDGPIQKQLALQAFVDTHGTTIEELVSGVNDPSAILGVLDASILPGGHTRQAKRMTNIQLRRKLAAALAEARTLTGSQSPQADFARQQAEAELLPEVERLRSKRDASLEAAVGEAMTQEAAAKREREFFERLDQQMQSLGVSGGL